MVDNLDYDELIKLKKDLVHGGLHLRKLVERSIRKIELSHKECCSFCGSEINKENVNTYTLVFGPHDFKKKSTFCGSDCMQSFLIDLESKRSGGTQ